MPNEIDVGRLLRSLAEGSDTASVAISGHSKKVRQIILVNRISDMRLFLAENMPPRLQQ